MHENKYIRTVTGKFKLDELLNQNIRTLPYEHLIQNLCDYVKAEPNYNDIKDPIELKNLFKLLLKPFSTYDNLSLEADVNKISNELISLKNNYTCNLICDVTSKNHGQNLQCLRAISQYTDMKICHGISIDYSFKDAKSYLNDIKYELNYGFDDQIPSFIGEVSISDTFPSEKEKEIFQNLFQLGNDYDIPIFLKLNSLQKNISTNTILSFLKERQINNKKKWVFSVTLSDQDNYEEDFALISEITKNGYSVVLCIYDCDLTERNKKLDLYYNKEKASFINKTLIALRQFTKQIMISNNINFKIQLKEYGGFGYDNLFINYIDKIFEGLSQEEQECIVKKNLLLLLSWWKKPTKQKKEIPLIRCESCGTEKEETNQEIFRKFDKTFCTISCLKKYLTLQK